MLRAFTTSVILATTPIALAYPQPISPYTPFQTQRADEKRAEKDYIFSYDDVLHLLDEIESGELENRCTPEGLKRVKHFVAFLAKEGVLPDGSEESMSLDGDIEDLLGGEDNIYKDVVSFVLSDEYQYLIVPALLNGNGEIVSCKGRSRKQWDHVKKFVKKYKKELIIGAAIVVAAAVVIVAVVAASSAAGAATASAAGAAVGSPDSNQKSDECDQQVPIPVPADIPPAAAAAHEAPIM